MSIQNRFKFRMWNPCGKRMYGINESMVCLCQQITDRYDHISDGFVFMQSTGLRDKNLKLIYEGDLLGLNDDFFGVVVFHDSAFCIKDDPNGVPTRLLAQRSKRLEVIGNIYEHPQLQEQRK